MCDGYSTHPKSELNRFHAMAERRGFVLEKSRKRDPSHRLYDRYWLYRLDDVRNVIWRYGTRLGFEGLKGVDLAYDVPSVEQFFTMNPLEQKQWAHEFPRSNFNAARWDELFDKLASLIPN